MKHNNLIKNFKTNLTSQITTNSIILVNKITILANKIIILVITHDYFGIRAKFIPKYMSSLKFLLVKNRGFSGMICPWLIKGTFSAKMSVVYMTMRELS